MTKGSGTKNNNVYINDAKNNGTKINDAKRNCKMGNGTRINCILPLFFILPLFYIYKKNHLIYNFYLYLMTDEIQYCHLLEPNYQSAYLF